MEEAAAQPFPLYYYDVSIGGEWEAGRMTDVRPSVRGMMMKASVCCCRVLISSIGRALISVIWLHHHLLHSVLLRFDFSSSLPVQQRTLCDDDCCCCFKVETSL